MSIRRETVNLAIDPRRVRVGDHWPPEYRPVRAAIVGPVAIHRPPVEGGGFARKGWRLSSRLDGSAIGDVGAFALAVMNARQLATIPESAWPYRGPDGKACNVSEGNPVIAMVLQLIKDGYLEYAL